MTGPDPKPGSARQDDRPSGNRGAESQTFADLLSSLVRDLSGLVRSEGRLVRAEMAEAGRSVAVGVEMMAAGGLILLVAALVLVQSGIIVLAHYVGPGWAAAIVGSVLGLAGVVLILQGRRAVSAARLLPERTLEQTSRDIRLAKEQI